MSLNPVTCGNCGTENPPDQDVCTKCGLPLTGSADEALRENLGAEDRGGGLFGGGATSGTAVQPTEPGLGLSGSGGGILPPR
jgi:hypothetical protein